MNDATAVSKFLFARARVYIYALFALFLTTSTFAQNAPADRIARAHQIARDHQVSRIPELSRQLSTETDRQVRQGIVVALANLGEPAFDALRSTLNDPSPEVRLEAVVGIGRIATPEAGDVLVEHLRGETNDGVRMAAIFWLGEMRHPRAEAAVAALSGSGNRHVRIEVNRALGRIRNRR